MLNSKGKILFCREAKQLLVETIDAEGRTPSVEKDKVQVHHILQAQKKVPATTKREELEKYKQFINEDPAADL